MTLPASGPLLASMINVELGRNANDYFHLNGAAERALAQVPTGQVDFADFYGKSRGFPTPDTDYPTNAVILKKVAVPAPTVRNITSFTFESDGVITVDGTSTPVMPLKWYQNATPPAGYKASFAPANFSNSVDPATTWSVSYPPSWQDMVSSPTCYVQITTSATSGTGLMYVESGFTASISNGSQIVAQFYFTLRIEVNSP